MDFGMPFLLETQTQEDCILLCQKLGLQFIEWNMNFLQCQLKNLNPNELNRIQKETGIYFTLHLEENLNVCEFNDKVRGAYLDTVLQAIERAKQIKAPIINMHLAKGKSNHLAFGDGEIDLRQRLGMAKQANARVVLETKTIEALTKTVNCKSEFLT